MGAATLATDLRTLTEGPHVHRNLSTPQLVVAGVKRAEDNDDVIVRIYEAYGGSVRGGE